MRKCISAQLYVKTKAKVPMSGKKNALYIYIYFPNNHCILRILIAWPSVRL